MNEKKYVWLVLQTQPDENYFREPIAVFDNKEAAVKLARKYNKEYGYNCKFTRAKDFIEQKDYDDCHFYEAESFCLYNSADQF